MCIRDSGYPRGQWQEETPIDARIIHVSDAYDAMTTDRPYRPAMTHAQAISIIAENAGKQFDPRIVDVLLNMPLETLTLQSPPSEYPIEVEDPVMAVAG